MTSELPSIFVAPWSTFTETVIGACSSSPAVPAQALASPEVAPRSTDEVQAAADLLNLLTESMSAGEYRPALKKLCDGLRLWSGCERVILGLSRRRGVCRVVEVTELVQLDERAEWIRVAEAALDETFAHEVIVAWPPEGEHGSPIFRQLRVLTSLDAIAGVPLRNAAGDRVGALLLGGTTEWLRQAMRSRRLDLCQRPIASCVELLRDSQGSPGRRARRAWQRLRARVGARFVFVAVALVAGLALVPFPYRLKCDVAVEPVTRRFVAAPFDGTLKESLVEPGEIVTSGHLLATMDERELRWELAGLDAEYGAAKKKRDTALANREAITAQLAGLEMEQIDTRVQTLRHRTANLQIQCPIDGVVVSGDLKRTEGAPLTIGQPLFEIAPLNQMIAELEIPQDEIAHVQTGAPVELRFEAFSGRTWSGVIERIHPRAEVRDRRTVFVAEVRLDNPDELLRPGMSGRAKVSSPARSLGWIVFHRPWHAWRQKVGW